MIYEADNHIDAITQAYAEICYLAKDPSRGANYVTVIDDSDHSIKTSMQIDEALNLIIAVEAKNLSRTLRKYKSRSAHQGRAHSEDELKIVAEIYQSAVRAHEPVQATVAKTLGVSVSTAAKRIMVARSRGYIPGWA